MAGLKTKTAINAKAASVRFDNLSKVYGGKVRAVDSLNLSVATGTLLGPSGCSKSKTLRMIAGREGASMGRIFIGDTDVTKPPAASDCVIGTGQLHPAARFGDTQMTSQEIPRVHVLFHIARNPPCRDIGQRHPTRAIAPEHRSGIGGKVDQPLDATGPRARGKPNPQRPLTQSGLGRTTELMKFVVPSIGSITSTVRRSDWLK